MKSALLTLTLALSLARAAEAPRVSVQMDEDPNLSLLDKQLVRRLVERMYDEIGVTIRWERSRKTKYSAPIKIELRSQTPPEFMPRALAYAMPYEGTHIVVFYDRIAPKVDSAYFLAHVIAHEIGHILEGFAGHARVGIMKAEWTAEEQAQMRRKSLGFAPLNAERIQHGAADRELKQISAVTK